MPTGLHHLAIQVSDLARCERFYREVLGLPVLRRWPDGAGGERSVWLDAGGGAFIALERAGDAGRDGPGRPGGQGEATEPPTWKDDRPGLHLVALRIAAGERAGWERRLATAGVEVVARTGWTLYLRDPEGNRVGLSHHPEEAP